MRNTNLTQVLLKTIEDLINRVDASDDLDPEMYTDMRNLLSNAWSEITFYVDEVERLKHEVDHAELNVLNYAHESVGYPPHYAAKEGQTYEEWVFKDAYRCCGLENIRPGDSYKISDDGTIKVTVYKSYVKIEADLTEFETPDGRAYTVGDAIGLKRKD